MADDSGSVGDGRRIEGKSNGRQSLLDLNSAGYPVLRPIDREKLPKTPTFIKTAQDFSNAVYGMTTP